MPLIEDESGNPKGLGASGQGPVQTRKLPKRDWLLLPLLSVTTVLAVIGASRLVTAHLYRLISTGENACMVLTDPETGVRGRPNTVCRGKLFETETVEFRFNGCGYRAGMECGPKPPYTYRIVMVGSSFAEGTDIARERSLAALLPADVARLTGRKVDLYNEGLHWVSPRAVSLKFRRNEVQAAQPDLILWIVTPWDVDNAGLLLPGLDDNSKPEKTAEEGNDRGSLLHETIEVFSGHSLANAMGRGQRKAIALFADQPTALLLKHYLYQSQSLYLKHYFTLESHNDFLRVPRTALYAEHIQEFGRYFGEGMAAADKAGVPVAVTFLPVRGQAAMISMGQWPDGYDPYRVGEDIRSLAGKYGATYIDVLRGFREVPNPELDFLPIDGHPTADGYRILSGMIAQQLTDGTVTALKATSQPETRRSK